MNHRLLDAAKDSLLLSLNILDGCKAAVRGCLPALVAYSEAVSLLDMLLSFATTVSTSVRSFVRPRFTVDGPLAIQNGRHPMACASMASAGTSFVGNSVLLSKSAPLVVVTGANMSGKV